MIVNSEIVLILCTLAAEVTSARSRDSLLLPLGGGGYSRLAIKPIRDGLNLIVDVVRYVFPLFLRHLEVFALVTFEISNKSKNSIERNRPLRHGSQSPLMRSAAARAVDVCGTSATPLI
jgi:hypothetical protein